MIKNSIEQIIKETPIQLATQEDIFLLKYNDGVIRSFEDFFCIYSSKDIFNEINDKIINKYQGIQNLREINILNPLQ